MVTTFVVRERWEAFSDSVAAVAGVAFLMSMVGLFTGRVSGIVAGVLILILGGFLFGRKVLRIEVVDDGTIEFVRLIGVTRVPVREIHDIEGRRILDEYSSNVRWEMRVRYRQGDITVPFFWNAREFVEAVHALDPKVRAVGEWPGVGPGPGAVPSHGNADTDQNPIHELQP